MKAPVKAIDCGNSGTTMRLIAGLLAGQDFSSELTGDYSLCKRPMNRIIDPLEKMGARLTGHGEKQTAPLTIHGQAPLQAIGYPLPMASAQVKSCVLLAGLLAEGETSVIEPTPTRDHTERMFASFGIACSRTGDTISLTGPQVPRASGRVVVPGDISSAAFWMVAAATSPGSRVTIRGVGLNPTRTGVIDVLKRMGAEIDVRIDPACDPAAEPYGDLTVTGPANGLKGTVMEGAEIPNIIDELPILAVAGALAHGATEIRGAAELRVKETDRIAAVAANLRAMGAAVTEYDDGMSIEGGHPLHGALLESFGDHRLAMSFAIAGLRARGRTTMADTACVATSYPLFHQHLNLVLDQS
jgi:3-phosphoshikimate 1-carboxyvinyltransferase